LLVHTKHSELLCTSAQLGKQTVEHETFHSETLGWCSMEL